MGYQSSSVIQTFPLAPLGWRRSALQSSHTRDYSFTRLCAGSGENQSRTSTTILRINSWRDSISFLSCKHSYLFHIHFTKTSLIFFVTIPHSLRVLHFFLNNLCFVLNSMWLSLIPGSNVPVWVAPMASERKKDAWLLSTDIFAMLLRACFLTLARSSGLVAILAYTAPKESIWLVKWAIYLLFSTSLYKVVSMASLNLSLSHRDCEDIRDFYDLQSLFIHKYASNIAAT